MKEIGLPGMEVDGSSVDSESMETARKSSKTRRILGNENACRDDAFALGSKQYRVFETYSNLKK
jgi:hypothetical protein